MLDYVAYLTAQREVRDLATSALPTAPIRPDPGAPAAPGRRLRRRAAQALVRAAARLEPSAVAAQRGVTGSGTPPRPCRAPTTP